MNEIPARSVGETILNLIDRHDGKLGWHQIAAEVGTNAVAERGEIFIELRSLERRGMVRRQHGEGDALYWIVRHPELIAVRLPKKSHESPC